MYFPFFFKKKKESSSGETSSMRRLKSVIGTEHPVVAKVKELTSSEKWAPHSTAMVR